MAIEVVLPRLNSYNEITEICRQNILAGMSYSACARAIRVSYQTWNNWQNLGREGKAPYAKWHIAIQEAEALLLRECLDQSWHTGKACT